MPEQPSFEFPLSEQELILRYGPAVHQRALSYIQHNKVFRVEHDDQFDKIEAQVWGNSLIPYRQKIRLVRDGNDWHVDARCSCPVRSNCKHTLAVLLKVIQQQQEKGQQQQVKLHQWLNSLQQVDQQVPDFDYKDRVLYILEMTTQGLAMSPRRARRLKKGGYGQGSLLSEHDFRQGYIPHWGCSEDFRLLGLISSQNRFGQLLLKEQWGALALDSMLQSGRCFLQSVHQPIERGPSLPLQLEWQQDSNQRQLAMHINELEQWQLIDTTPPMYLNISKRQIGQIDTQLSGEQLHHLQQMPAVPDDELAHVWFTMQQALATTALPAPDDIEIKLVNAEPEARLILTMQPDSRGKLRPVAKLVFAYEAVELDPAGSEQDRVSHCYQANQHYAVTRKLATEQSALQQLTDCQLFAKQMPTTEQSRFFTVVDDRPQSWLSFIEQDIPWLQQQGWQVRQSQNFDLGIVDADTEFDVESSEPGWFSLDMTVQVADQSVPIIPLVQQWLQQHGEPDSAATLWLPLPDGKTLRLPADQLQPLFSTLLEFMQHGEPLQKLRLPNHRSQLLQQLAEHQITFRSADHIRQLSERLQNFSGIETVPLPSGLQAELRPYQQQGLNWLEFLQHYGFGGILADDMGLGKTLQTLAFLLHQQQNQPDGFSALVVCPTSLIGNWQQEAERFTPALKVLLIHGQQRAKALESLEGADLIITTYPLVARDMKHYQAHHFSHIILDEAQQIKNSRSQTTTAIRKLQAGFKLCLSGTPLENHLGELKSLFDFALPGLLGTDVFFRNHYKKPIEREQHSQRAAELRQRVAPFMLRRSKSQVMSELPDKVEIEQLLELDQDQRHLYDSIRLSMETRIRQLFAEKGMAKSQIEFLDALLKLRQVCCDARLVKLDSANNVKTSAKLIWLQENLPEMIAEGRKIILFSQFTSMLALIEEAILQLNIPYAKLTGQTKKRQQQIDAFQQGDVPLFLVSLKAGGTGLNLTAADTVIHYDPWWNPAVMQQATDRAHRIGQDKRVFVYKLIAKDTVEQKIQVLQQQKQALADTLFSGKTDGLWQGNADELLQLFS